MRPCRRPRTAALPAAPPTTDAPSALRALVAGLVAAAAIVAAPGAAGAWGTTGHRAIASNYSENLPAALDGLRAQDAWILQHVMDPDTRKSSVPGEGYRHYIDLDAYPEYASGTLPHDRAVLEARYGASQVLAWGVAPWAIGEVVDSLTACMATARWSAVPRWIADLAHYVGDLHQPLHCTRNYDGQYTGNNGIHSRYESTMLDTYAAFLSLDAGTVQYVPDVVDGAFAVATASQQAVAQVLTADTEAKAAAGGSTSSSTYYIGLWGRTQELTLARLDGASVGTASLVYTAWVNAGGPTVPGSSVDVAPPPAGAGAGGAVVLAAGPSPARTGEPVQVRFTLPVPGTVTVSVYDAAGRRHRVLLAGEQGAGPGAVTWTPGAAGAGAGAGMGAADPPGIYFVTLESAGRRATARVVVTR